MAIAISAFIYFAASLAGLAIFSAIGAGHNQDAGYPAFLDDLGPQEPTEEVVSRIIASARTPRLVPLPLTGHQAFVCHFVANHRLGPTITEVSKHLGLSYNGAWSMIRRLEKRGLVFDTGIEVITGRRGNRSTRWDLTELGYESLSAHVEAEQ